MQKRRDAAKVRVKYEELRERLDEVIAAALRDRAAEYAIATRSTDCSPLTLISADAALDGCGVRRVL